MGRPPAILIDDVSFAAGGRDILSNVSLVFRPGQVCAILGPSGCGKTTLLKCAAAVQRPSAGAVRVGGKDVWEVRRDYRRLLGYVPQDDIVHPELTVERALRYSALLRLDGKLAAGALDQRVQTVLQVLGLDERRSTRVRRLSGGQRKRVNIGIELLADPDILILDEPASGLDPGTEEDLLRLLARLAKQGRTVALTTHSMEQLALADVLVLMAEGRLVFAGRLEELLAHFGVAHAAEIYKPLRQGGAELWAAKFRDSPLAARARMA